MTPGSLVGFALVFVVCTWTLSTIAGLALSASRAGLERLGPMAERRAAEAAAIVPVVLATIAIVTLVLRSIVGVDHCEAHGHHAHLCIVHGARWIERTWIVVTLTMAGVVMLGRLVRVTASFVRGARSIRDLHAISRDAGDVRIIESSRAFCFVAGGRRPAIYVSSHAWCSLTELERQALVAHEAAHLDQADLRTRAVLEGFLVLAAPLVGDRVRTMWLQASERLCDARAAAAIGEPAAVASAMVSLCRLHVARPVAGVGFTPTARELAGRVHAVLAEGPLGERAAAILRGVVLAASFVIAATIVIAAEPLHHAFETLFG